MAEIAKFKNANLDPDPEVVDVLRKALALAESGKLRDVALTGSLTGHATLTDFYTHDLVSGVGMLELLKHKMLDAAHSVPMPEE